MLAVCLFAFFGQLAKDTLLLGFFGYLVDSFGRKHPSRPGSLAILSQEGVFQHGIDIHNNVLFQQVCVSFISKSFRHGKGLALFAISDEGLGLNRQLFLRSPPSRIRRGWGKSQRTATLHPVIVVMEKR